MFILFYWNVTLGILKPMTDKYFFEHRLRQQVDFFEADTWCRIFRPINWYHSLVPPKQCCQVIWDLGHFLVSLLWPVTWKLIFEVWFWFWGLIIFQFPIRLPSLFFSDLFWKNSLPGPVSLFHSPHNFTLSKEDLFWKNRWHSMTMHISCHNGGPVVDWMMDAEMQMAEGKEGCYWHWWQLLYC